MFKWLTNLFKPKSLSMAEFIRAKNKILREDYGIDFDLVPEDQIVDMPKIKKLNTSNVSYMCPYCAEGLREDNCNMCPMSKANNQCDIGPNNTWTRFLRKIDFIGLKDYYNNKRIAKLIKWYNKDIK